LLKKENIFKDLIPPEDFKNLCLEVFRFQYKQNLVYQQWVDLLGIQINAVQTIESIPFLPIEFFKNFQVISSPLNAQTIKFTSSATTSQIPASHYVNNIDFYQESFKRTFSLFYGDINDYCVLALLPNYLQRGGSSLVYMCTHLIKASGHPLSGFFLDDVDGLTMSIEQLKQNKQKVILIGVTYALMDLADLGVTLNDNFIVMETGGMKGTRKELPKPELHAYLKNAFKINNIHSEYGMTELLSQAYSTGNGLFKSPPWLKFLVREVNDPLTIRLDGKTGGINVIDLANLHSCSFIATKDLGRVNENNELELMGRYDQSDVRGCNLMLGNF
jgi:phenylacetate-coenzyme A ligase PaaK-like adenylate-forming protein